MTDIEAIAFYKEMNEQLVSVAKDENMYNYEKQEIEFVGSRRLFEANTLAIKALEEKAKNE